jgi:hypothetical protein
MNNIEKFGMLRSAVKKAKNEMSLTPFGYKVLAIAAVIATFSLNASAGLFGLGGTSWKEEVLLHDGQKIVVERHSSRGGRHELTQGPPIKEQSVTFSVPGSNRSVVWKSEYSQDVGRANFNLRAVHILNGTPYIVAEPNLCLSYNKWGRPNPPYVFFRYDGKNWQRIPLEEFPVEFKEMNVVISIDNYDMFSAIDRYPVIPASMVKNLNSSLTQREYKTIVREPMNFDPHWCPEMIPTSDGGWLGLGWFSDHPNRNACLQYCSREKVTEQNCPCNKLFEGK